MVTLKAFLDRGFQRSFLVMNSVSFILLSVIIFTISYYNSRELLSKNLVSSSKTATDYLYSQEISKISDHFNAMGSSGIYSSVTVLAKSSKSKIFESHFSKLPIIPITCSRDSSSDLIITEACSQVMSSFTLVIIFLLISFYLIGLIFIYRLLRSKTLSIFQKIADSLIDSESNQSTEELKISEIQDIKMKLAQRTAQIADLSKSSALATLSKQVAHDIRSPLFALKNILKAPTTDFLHQEAVFNSLDRLNSIAQNLLDASHDPRTLILPNKRRFQASKTLTNLAQGKDSEFPSREINFSIKCPDVVYLWFNETTFERIISNCWNNSIEAIEGKVTLKVEVLTKENKVSILLSDNGPGFSESFFINLAANKIESTKDFGYGIGLESAITSLHKDGSVINFGNTDTGALVEIIFSEKNFASKDDPLILVDDDKYIRYSWTVKAQESGIPIHTYSTIKEFLEKKDIFHKHSEIFIDSDLGDGIKGESFLADLYSCGFERLNLETGSDASAFQDFTHLNSIVSKSFPY